MTYDSDILVIGSGIGGLYFALKAAAFGKVHVVTKKARWESTTNLAQGGIASVMSQSDSYEAHIRDTLAAGAGLCHRDIVEKVVQAGPSCIQELSRIGVGFSGEPDGYDLGREGGHSQNRVVHAADFTGRAIEQALIRATRSHPNIEIYEHHYCVDLITQHHLQNPNGFGPIRVQKEKKPTCFGAYVFDSEEGRVETFRSRVTLMATGGGGRIYFHTTNPEIATADGVAMAYLAGARIGNLEFVQFHPTTLFHPQGNSFLISEAVRGEGGRLILKSGELFMKKYHPMAELAPRDVVARAIDSELKRTGNDCVYLDVTHLGRDFLQVRFPTIFTRCAELGIDMAAQPIPVVPAAHYFCGGVVTDDNGKTDIENLYACGEVAMTGMHGANRLASNSLLEAVAFAKFSAITVEAEIGRIAQPPEIPAWDESGVFDSEEWVIVSHDRHTLTRMMWDYVGIVRSNNRLRKAWERCHLMVRDVREFYRRNPVRVDVVELRNMVTAAQLLIESAIQRRESRGLHYNIDYPHRDDVNYQRDTIIKKEPD
ncbi:MAG: L-aspartate oxidase [candidate division Zixibacteria bacterium RBG_16_53_22]|nr:MAG: L-aspartate oxidase [candidate division Zixibacteria bacterium RBG_16_53_22]